MPLRVVRGYLGAAFVAAGAGRGTTSVVCAVSERSSVRTSKRAEGRWCSVDSCDAAQGRGHDALMRFIDAVSPFVRDVLDEPFPWKHGGQVIVVMSCEEYDEAVAALEALRD